MVVVVVVVVVVLLLLLLLLVAMVDGTGGEGTRHIVRAPPFIDVST
jgi:hypothetical protein